jgi:SPP1 gp7 family putative phage head morphogenesis protein
MNDDQWLATVRDYRNIVGDPDAAKRLHIVRGPVDFTETASKPSELQLAELSETSRENILAAWGVPLSQIGIMQTSGLNSGEHVKYEEAALWQGAIDYRADSFEEKVQELIDLFGLGLTLVVDTPAFDDQQPLYVNAEKAKVVPLTVDERRALVGLDPLQDRAVGAAIFLDQTMVQINSLPGEQETEPPVKAELRQRTEKQWQPRLQEALSGFLARQATAIANRVKRNHAHLVSKPSDIRVWWNERPWNSELSELLEPLLGEMAGKVSRGVSRSLSPAKADSFLERVIALVRLAAGKRITAINDTTRDEIQRLVVAGVDAGLGPAELAQTISESTSFNAARAELIARTETMNAYNEAALHTYREFEVTEVEAIDGDDDAECAERNGKRYPIDEAFSIADHPNGTLDWIPVVP